MSYYTNEQIKFRKYRIDKDRQEVGLEPMYAPHEKSEFNPDARPKKKPKRK